MADEFELHITELEDPAEVHYAISPSDSVDLATRPRALYVNAEGTVAIQDKLGTDITYNVTAGQIIPFRGTRILATGTTATVVGWY